MKQALVIALLSAGLACEIPAGDSQPPPTPTPVANPTPTPDGTPDPNATPDPVPMPTPVPTDDPTPPTPTPTPDPNGANTNGTGGADLGCLESEMLVSVSDVCDLDGSNLGCCPTGFPTVSDDCFCLPDDGTIPGPTPQPTPPPFTCNGGFVLVRLPEGCEIDDTGFACCPEDLPSIDAECFCVEFTPPE